MQDSDYIFQKQSLKDDIGTIVISLLLTVVFHLALLKIIPSKIYFESKKPQQMQIEILAPKLEKKLPQFIEANPYGNELKPEKDAPTSFKNQRVADELPEKQSKSSRPFVKGEDNRYKKIVSGTSDTSDILNPALVPQVLERPLTEYTRALTKTANNPKQSTATEESKSRNEQTNKQADTKKSTNKKLSTNAKTDIIKLIAKSEKLDSAPYAKNKDAILIPIQSAQKESAKKQEKEIKIEVKTSSAKTVKVLKTSQAKALSEIPTPRPRPRLSMKIPAGPLLDNNRASSNAGIVSVDSRFSEFGAYQQRMIEAISRQWNLLGSKYDLSSAYGSQVLIEFSLNTEGELAGFKIVFSTSTNTGTGLCEQAILSTAPYGIWTQEMVNTLGTQPQKVRINFIYR